MLNKRTMSCLLLKKDHLCILLLKRLKEGQSSALLTSLRTTVKLQDIFYLSMHWTHQESKHALPGKQIWLSIFIKFLLKL